jgi:hypothetical protein
MGQSRKQQNPCPAGRCPSPSLHSSLTLIHFKFGLIYNKNNNDLFKYTSVYTSSKFLSPFMGIVYHVPTNLRKHFRQTF